MESPTDQPNDAAGTPPAMQIRDIQRETIWKRGRLAVEHVRWNDGVGASFDKHLVRAPHAVLIIPVRDDGSLVMIRNARIAAEEALWEFPAGGCEVDESPITTAHRELVEEGGCRAASMHELGTFLTSSGLSDERMTVFRASELEDIGQQLESYERIETHTVSRDEVETMVAEGRIRDGKSIAALFLLQQYEESVDR